MAPLFAHFHTTPSSIKHGLNNQKHKEGWLTSPTDLTISTKNITSAISTTRRQSLAQLIARSGGNSDFAGYTPEQKKLAEDHDAPIAKWAGPMVIGIILVLILIWCFFEWRHGFPKIPIMDKEEITEDITALQNLEVKKTSEVEVNSSEPSSAASSLKKPKTATYNCRSGKTYLECDCTTSRLEEKDVVKKLSWAHLRYVLTGR